MKEVSLTLIDNERDVLTAALKMCLGKFPWAYKGWGEETHSELKKLIEKVEDTQIKYECPWSIWDKEYSKSELFFNNKEKRLFVSALILYLGGDPAEYEGAKLWKKEAFRLVYKFATFQAQLNGSLTTPRLVYKE